MHLTPQNPSPSIRVSRPHRHCGPDMFDQSWSLPYAFLKQFSGEGRDVDGRDPKQPPGMYKAL